MRTTPIALALALPLLAGGCAVVAGGVAAVVITQEVMDNNTYVSHINMDVGQVWPTVKLFLAENSLELIEADDDSRVATATIDGTKVTVGVEAYDIDKSIVRVAAKRYGMTDGDTARILTERINRRLEQDAATR